MYKTNQTDHFLFENIQNQKESLRLTFLKNFDTQEKTLELLLTGINHAKFNEFEDTKFIWNIAAFINIISFDFKIVGQDLMLAENEWQKRYYARQASLIIYESINDLFDLLGKEFKNLVTTKISDSNITNELIKVKSELNAYKTKYFDSLKDIRNISIAHRDNDSIKQINSIINICWSDTIGMVTSFDKILNHLGEIIQRLINIGLEKFEELKLKNKMQ